MSQKNFEQTLISSKPPINHRIIQNFLLVWLDSNIDEINNEDCRLSLTELQRIVKAIHTFTNADECIDLLSDLINEQAFMIVSGTMGQRIVPLVHEMPQLASLYIFCENESMHKHWVKNWSKVKGVFTQITPICKALSQAAQQCDQNSISISFIPATNDVSYQNLDELDQSFMYTQILKEILLEMTHNEQSTKDFAAYCRDQYIGNCMELSSVNEFEKEYHHHSPIWWYTSPAFIYSMLNRALRAQEIDTIIKMGFFICDLHRHIKQLHTEEFTNRSIQPFNVYRGQGMSKTDFDKMMNTRGGLISFNNFLSTSTDQAISRVFADSNAIHLDVIGILFEITVDPMVSSTPFARLDSASYYKDLEQEILFSMHTVFRIGEIKQIDNNNSQLWHVKLTLTSDNDQQLKALTECMREKTIGYNGWHRLTRFLIEFGEFDKAEQMSWTLLNLFPNMIDKPSIYDCLELIKKGQGDYVKALSFFEKELLIIQKLHPPNDHYAAAVYSNIGWIYQEIGKYSEALYFIEKAVQIREKILPSNDPALATAYNNIAVVYQMMSDYSKAIFYQQKALDIKEKVLPHNHHDLAISYNIMGGLCERVGKYAEDLSFRIKTLEIRKKSLPPNHPSMVNSYSYIAKACSRLGKDSEAILYLEMALEILGWQQIFCVFFENFIFIF
jgi:tetratricopeptide (TPR) repeat protein